MKSLLIVFALFGSLTATAQSDDRSAKGSLHNVSVVTSFTDGGVNLGLAYEHMYQDSVGIMGHFRWFPKEDDPGNRSDGMIIVGAGLGHHFYKKSWDLAFTPSFNILNIDSATPTKEDTTAFGPGLSLSLVCQMSANVAFGFDWANYWIWFDEDFAGKQVDDFGLKLRMSF